MIHLCAVRQDCDPFQYTAIPGTYGSAEQFHSTAESLPVSDRGIDGVVDNTAAAVEG